MSTKDRSAKAKTKKHIKVSTKNKIIITVVIIFLALLCFAYIANETGLPAKVLPGAKIVHTVDGKEKTVKRVSIVEMNYYYALTYNQYVQYGLIKDESTLDEVYNPANGQTYRDMLWENAANSAQTQYLLYEAAEKAGFKPVAADRYAETQVDAVRESCDYMNTLRGSNMTADQYLQNMYGKGMTVQIYRKIMKRAAVVDEYRTSLQQSTFVPNQADLQAKFDEDPEKYTYAHFQLYFIQADIPENATDEQKQKALDEALKKAQAISDGCVNAVEFQTRVMQVCTEEYRDRFAKGETPTAKSGYNKEQIASISPEFADFCFDPNTEANSGMAFIDKESIGAYAALFEDTYVDDTPVCSYRVLKLDDDLLKDISKTLEQKAPSHQKLHAKAAEYMASVTTEEQFSELAKKYSVDSSTFLIGGYVSGVKESDFKGTVLEEGGEPQLAPEDQQLKDWLMDPSRKKGDMLIIDCVASVNLYYYCDSVPLWMDTIRTDMTSENYNTWYTGTVSDTSYSTVVNHGLIDFFS